MAWDYVVFDIEANGFKPTEMFCICMSDIISGENLTFPPEQIPEALMILADAKMLIGHYIKGYDCPVIERLTDGLVTFDKRRLVDTLEMSKKLAPHMKKHGLESWGDVLGLPKLKQPLFEVYDPTMLPYCERDVALNVKVFWHLIEVYLEGDCAIDFPNADTLTPLFEAVC